MNDQDPSQPLPASQPPTGRPRRGLARRLMARALPPLLGLALIAGGGLWTLTTSNGARWTLGWVPGLQVQGLQGSWADGLRIDRLEWSAQPAAAPSGTRVVAEAVEWAAPSLDWTPSPATWAVLRVSRLSAAVVELKAADGPTGRPAGLPDRLELPLEVTIDSIKVDSLRLPGQTEPVRQLRAGLLLGADGGRSHRVHGFEAQWQGIQASGDARIGAEAPLALQADVRLQSPGGPVPPWTLALQARGPLQGFELSGQLDAVGQTLRLDAQVTPAAAWPLPRLDLQADRLDLSALGGQWPATALTGRLRVRPDDAASSPGAAPLVRDAAPRPLLLLEAQLRNLRPGLAAQAALPLSRLDLQARLDAADPRAGVEVSALRAELADGRAAAGTLSGQGRWTPQDTALELRLDGVRLPVLDARLPAMRLSGPLKAQASGSSGAADDARLRAEADLAGERLDAPAALSAVALKGRLDAGWQAVEVRSLSLQVGASVATGGFVVRRPPGAAASRPASAPAASAQPPSSPTFQERWQAVLADAGSTEGRLQLTGFDPGLWWLADAGSAWRQRSSRLTGDARWAVQWPAVAQGSTDGVVERLAGMLGDLTLQLDPGSTLLAVPLRAEVRLQRAELATPLQVQGRVEAGGNRLALDASRLALTGKTAPTGQAVAGAEPRDRLTLALEAPALGTLRPWWRAAMAGQSASGTGPELAGALQARLKAEGQWPWMRTEGSFQARALRAGAASVAQAEGLLAASPWAGEALRLQLAFQSARQGGQVLDQGLLRVDGTLEQHTVGASVQARAIPPTLLRLLGAAPGEARADERSRWTLQTQGRWQVASGPASEPAAARAVSPPLPAGLEPALRAWLESRATQWTMQQVQARIEPARAGAPIALSPVVAAPVVAAPLVAAPVVAAPGAAVAPGLPAEWLAAQLSSLVVDVPGRPLPPPAVGAPTGTDTARPGVARSRVARADPLPPIGPSPLELPSPWQVRSGGGQLRSAAVTLQWERLRWQQSVAGQAGAFEADARLEPVAVGPLLQRLQPGFGWGGDLLVGGRLQARSGADPARDLQLDLRVERQSGDLFVDEGGLRQALGLSELAVALSARDGRWTLDLGTVGRRLGRLSGRIETPAAPGSAWPAAASPVQGRLLTQVDDLGVWGAWVPAGWRLGGQVRSEIDIGGTLGDRRLTGELRGDALTVRNPLLGVSITDGQLLLRLQGDRAQLEVARARAGAGTLVVTGGMAAEAGKPVTELQVVAEQFQLLGRVDRRIVTSGRARLRLEPGRFAVDGRFGVDEGLIDFSRRDAPELSEDVVIDGKPAPDEAGEVPVSRTEPTAIQIAVDLQLDLGERLRVRGRGLDAGLRGQLRVSSPANRLALNGTIRAVDGTYAAYGQRLVLSRGNVVFAGPLDNPRLDIQATRPNLDVVVGVSIVGPAAAPRVRLFSEPEMSETEKLSWLVLGRGSDGLGRSDAALLQQAAIALLAGEDGGSKDPISALLGLDTLSLSQSEGENTRDTVLTLGKQLNRRWYVGYERSLNAATGSFQLIYRLARRFTLRAQSGEDNSLDLIWTWRWQ